MTSNTDALLLALDASAPASVRESYAAAARLGPDLPEEYAVAIRGAMEVLCEDRDTPECVVRKKLAFLVSRGEIPAALVSMPEIIELFSNSERGAGQGSITSDEAWGMGAFFCMVVNCVYVTPHKVQMLKDEVARRAAVVAA
jgi:hypothetical protein